MIGKKIGDGIEYFDWKIELILKNFFGIWNYVDIEI